MEVFIVLHIRNVSKLWKFFHRTLQEKTKNQLYNFVKTYINTSKIIIVIQQTINGTYFWQSKKLSYRVAVTAHLTILTVYVQVNDFWQFYVFSPAAHLLLQSLHILAWRSIHQFAVLTRFFLLFFIIHSKPIWNWKLDA